MYCQRRLRGESEGCGRLRGASNVVPTSTNVVAGGRTQVLTVDIALPDVEELQKLVATGQEKGFLTYDEIVKGIEEVELTKEQVEDFTTYLINHGVELVEGEEHKRLPHERPLVEEEVKSAPKLDLT